MPRSSAKTPSVQDQIDRMVERTVEKCHPDMIILFGSHARGESGPDSDLDLLMVMQVEGSIDQKRLEIRRALRDRFIPVDIIVTTPQDFAWRKDVVGTIEWQATREGKVLYTRS
jgi:uncharacterized protein